MYHKVYVNLSNRDAGNENLTVSLTQNGTRKVLHFKGSKWPINKVDGLHNHRYISTKMVNSEQQLKFYHFD